MVDFKETTTDRNRIEVGIMAIESEALFGLLTILAVGIFTPGPNNITAISHSAVHGARSNISLVIGMVIGFIAVHMIIGLAIEQIDENSLFFTLLEWLGLLFFILLGIIIYESQSIDWPSTRTSKKSIFGMELLFNL